MVRPKFNSHIYKLERWVGHKGEHLSLFCNPGSEEVLLLVSAQCPKKIGDWPINATPSPKKEKKKKKKKCEQTHEPINMNHNMLFNMDHTIWHTSMVKRLGILN